MRLHNAYAQLIIEEFKNDPYSFRSTLLTKEEKDEIIFQEARKMVIAVLQRIFYKEWLAKLNIELPEYKFYNSNVRAEVSHAFNTASVPIWTYLDSKFLSTVRSRLH